MTLYPGDFVTTKRCEFYELWPEESVKPSTGRITSNEVAIVIAAKRPFDLYSGRFQSEHPLDHDVYVMTSTMKSGWIRAKFLVKIVTKP